MFAAGSITVERAPAMVGVTGVAPLTPRAPGNEVVPSALNKVLN